MRNKTSLVCLVLSLLCVQVACMVDITLALYHGKGVQVTATAILICDGLIIFHIGHKTLGK